MPPRLITGALYLCAWVVLAWVGGWPLTVAVGLLSLTALLELRAVAARRRMRLAVEIGYPVCIAFVYSAHQFANDLEQYAVALLTLLVLLVVVDFALHLGAGGRAPTADLSLTVFGCLYCGLMFSGLVLVRNLQPDLLEATAFGGEPWSLGKRLLFFLLLVTMLSDSVAYLVGKSMGKRKLSGTVSPNKTLEGCVGSAVGGMLAGVLAGSLFHVGDLRHQLVLGLLLGALGQFGDFGASVFKREAEVKDYGSVFPGHGGVLDRFDTLLINAPLVFLYAQMAL